MVPNIARFAAVARLARASLVVAVLTAPTFAPPAGADLVLNEVLYDPAGADEGFEFVELWNPDSTRQSLDGIVIEAGDGARPGLWTVIYQGAAADSVDPSAAVLISAGVLSAPIQNGPDAIRLTRRGAPLDLLGYGDLTDPGLFEGAPAPDVGSGQSLARRRDGLDTNVNRDDWEPETSPTPGKANRPEIRLQLSPAGVSLSPEVGWPGQTATIAARVRCSGWRPVTASRWRLEVDLGDSVAWIPSGFAAGVALAPGESALVSCSLVEPAAGAFYARVRLRDLSPGPPAISDTVVIAARSVAGPVVVNEFAFRDGGAGEWIELWFGEPVPDLGAISISDATGRARAIDRGSLPRPVSAGVLLVVAEEPDAVRARFSLADSTVLGLIGGWPSLNDDGPDGAAADVVRVVSAEGVPCDAAPYRAGMSGRGGSVERLSPDLPSADPGTWAESIDRAGGTPGRPNSLRAPEGPESRGPLLVAGERVLRRPRAGAIPVVLRVTSEARGRKLTVRVHDLLGRPLRTLVDGQRFAAEGAFVWDGRDDGGEPVPPGIYVVRAETMPESGAPVRATNVLLAVAAERAR
jgi:hypothetical protein